ncbi:exodeoxyribonuclease VII small subunit [Pseudoalteromonas sp. MMG013]|uniref:Exodeoxyribonuclease 7 small subunit n=1 Tax=Pseudoalteromonas aurantia 208 TaxID=1314867 RepID=A0ABR9E8W6_9GAMM|nr:MULTISPECIES: exodeoxyribonuclease VII small subunit [Pseudoalteromonas]MBE0367202.1 exodeoxyribonuclease VII small subunit [Pseudoalteromonas aurantia 208]MBQ4845725.1 exodeoxyribonuclease VII small subunit [Pseudoalteromonas sp. MMG005]MBQ4850761.1 exodeoxyribonuclease VII small subunit [Pseudoalteromonas sp. MMG012]MBQ4861685.1 exodeoxyribonuclease VII small subunit [Pseudoalteromonas sp. MMG013]
MAVKKPENLSFEEAIHELESIVSAMEQGELTLEQSLKQFERGILLANASNQKLHTAEQKVAILMGSDTQSDTIPFTGSTD